MSKIQFLKANHNKPTAARLWWLVVYQCQRYNFWKQITTITDSVGNRQRLFINVKDTIFESKSQPINPFTKIYPCCLSMSKIQFLKANHNSTFQLLLEQLVVYQCQRYNFWKQITTLLAYRLKSYLLFINVKDTIFESKSQHEMM